MPTLKILWLEKQDMRRVQLAAVHQALKSNGYRSVGHEDKLSFEDLRNFVLLVFPELKDTDLMLYYMDDDDEQVRITNDAELDEAFRLMRELAVAAGKDANSAVCKIIAVSRTVSTSTNLPMDTSSNSKVNILPSDANEMLGSKQKRKMSDLFVDLGKVVDKWAATAEHQMLKKDIVSLLHEPGCQEAIMEIMANPKFAILFQIVTEKFQKNGNFVECLVAAAGTEDLEEVAKILLAKCPNARVQVERVLQQVQYSHNVQLMSTSDYFENINIEETKQDLGPVVAVFEGDVTCPDGTVLTPGEAFDKVWKLRNGGPSKWPIGAVLSCVGGDKMQAPESVLIPSVLPGKSIDVSLRMVAPMKAGRYTGYWRLSTPDGNRFGQRLWVDINVMEPEEPATSAVDTKEVHFEASDAVGSNESANAPAQTTVNVSHENIDKWANEQLVLADMGFTDKTRNLALLTLHDGDMDAVITGLLSSA
ncbi:phosphatidylinositol kinase [Plasmopara halstedii]|uniref:Phosphatidylinositol kinase n=1 Tax=Plasmopara halstedii TaxID=4781 RepID=A0A0P1AP55_PLAHL|nr:phosphatidylinositol kinase [Plasmopara halstedii]CEG43234.1 phosphatidylinositol kinase [Plasmopara halstedii]|eukprot:XP_024579603.1 phosphatidylinositol kinase [Plasmopara halstedii]